MNAGERSKHDVIYLIYREKNIVKGYGYFEVDIFTQKRALIDKRAGR